MIAAVAMELAAGWAALLAGMALSFLYSGLETGTYAVNKVRLDLRAASGAGPARRLAAMLADPGKPLIVVLVGNNLANYLASAGMVLILTSRAWPSPEWYAVAILTPLIFVFCELLPKNLFHRHGERLAYIFSGFLDLSRRVFSVCGLVGLAKLLIRGIFAAGRRPLGSHDSPLGPGRGRIAGILAEARAGGAITHTQSLIAQRIVHIGQVRLADVMVPLKKAVMVRRSASADLVRRLLTEHGHPRLGVYEGNRENIVGVLNAYDVLLDEDDSPPADHVMPPLGLVQHTGVIEALVALQRARTAIAFVVNDAGNCTGLVTVKDLVEEIVGELHEW